MVNGLARFIHGEQDSFTLGVYVYEKSQVKLYQRTLDVGIQADGALNPLFFLRMHPECLRHHLPGWDFKVYEPQTNLSHAACPWGGRLVKVILSKFEVRHPPEQMNCMLAPGP